MLSAILTWLLTLSILPQSLADQVFNDDVIVHGHIAVGSFASLDEAFGDNALKVTDSVVRILFNDASVEAGRPTNDWRIIINDEEIGGENKFSIEDSTGNTLPFTIMAGAPSNSLFMTSSGDLGLGTTVPITDLHILDDVEASMRLETTSSGQAWHLIGKLDEFALFDATEGTTPISIRFAAPDDSLHIASDGSIGLGTGDPSKIGTSSAIGRFFNLRANGATASTGVANGVFQGQLGAQNHFVHLGAPANQRIMRLQTSSGFTGFHVVNDSLSTYAVPNVISMKMSNGNVGLRVQNPAHPLQLASGAHVTAGGVFTNASSRTVKNNIRPIGGEEARETVRALQPVGYRYNEEPDENYVGFIAEDVPDLVATNDRKSLAPMDVVAVLTKVVQDQDRQLADQGRQLVEERQRNDKLEGLVEALMQRVTDLEQQSITEPATRR